MNVVRRKGLVSFIGVLCLLPAHYPAAVFSEASQGGGCGPSVEGVNRLRADLGLDNALATRANSLASSALRNRQAPPPSDIQSLTKDSLDGLNDAGDQLVQATTEISNQLEELKLPRQERLWNQRVSDMKAARTTLRSALRQDPIARGQRIDSLSATGVGPKTVYEAAANFQKSGDDIVNMIGSDQGGWLDVAKGQARVGQGMADAMPPPNPGPDPWQEWLKRLQAQQSRLQNSVNGLHAAQALRAGDFQQAQKNVAEMQKAMQSAQNLANQLSQLAALCNQAVNQRPSQNNPTQPEVTQSAGRGTGPSKVAKSGGNAGKVILGTTLAAAGVGVAVVALSACRQPDLSEMTGCMQYNCSSCVAVGQKLVTWCECLEQKHPNEAGGLATQCRNQQAQVRAAAARCEPAPNFTPLPVR